MDMWPCAVVNCLNQCVRTSEDVLFHRFPSDNLTRKKWLVKCGRKVDSAVSELSVCSAHFSSDDYEASTEVGSFNCKKRTHLKQEAIPHLNLFEIKQERLRADDIEFLEHRSQSSKACPNLPGHPSIIGSRLENADFDSGAIVESTDYNLGVIPDNVVESTSMIMKEEPSTSSSCSYIPSSLPASQNWPGEYNFQVTFRPQQKNTKGVSWTFSKLKDKLYVGKDMPCPINFSVDTVMPVNVTIRAMALYSSPEHTSEIVHRCPNHSMDERQQELFEAEHLVRCESSTATYDCDNTTRRHSVIVPFENPAVGQQFSTYIYKFTCFGSCSGGPNRRPLMLVFTLEKDGKVIGRRKLDVKICACPGRDRKTEEKLIVEQASVAPVKRKESELMSLSSSLEFTQSVMFPPPKKSKTTPNEDGYYYIKTRDKECHEFLRQIKRLFDICKNMKNLTPEAKRSLFNLSQKRLSDEDN